MIKILLFAGLADAAGIRELNMELTNPNMTVENIKQSLKEKYPSSAFIDVLDKSFASKNQEYVDLNTVVSKHDEVAFIPPVSGG
ncbi:molybdopterin converting factor subunit 1 [Chengkuizengella axinellae]|uniref:Molybdopterin synthase sulfur carrier subunit n=1 Tax=Chengkuizengella axinellae TaxID=3064388 RepID=A0ABT9J1Y8_9BACL|nr:molybdopterin converting factor subunit 1 [Chengkuizengella sp. 2205SS18-9]MDP5275607.1 molybdopterin converting factor subunit 1 [Chengkuizengella sp. 2205SS18-9]